MDYEAIYTEVITRLVASGLSRDKAVAYLEVLIDENIKNHFIKLIKRMRENSEKSHIN